MRATSVQHTRSGRAQPSVDSTVDSSTVARAAVRKPWPAGLIWPREQFSSGPTTKNCGKFPRLSNVLNRCDNQLKCKLLFHIILLRYNKTTLKCALCFSLLKSSDPPNDIISFFGPRLKKFADPWLPEAHRHRWFYRDHAGAHSSYPARSD